MLYDWQWFYLWIILISIWIILLVFYDADMISGQLNIVPVRCEAEIVRSCNQQLSGREAS